VRCIWLHTLGVATLTVTICRGDLALQGSQQGLPLNALVIHVAWASSCHVEVEKAFPAVNHIYFAYIADRALTSWSPTQTAANQGYCSRHSICRAAHS
jgi:hypothetical protein